MIRPARVGAALFLTLSSTTAVPADNLDAVRACASVAAPDARLECYDRAVGRTDGPAVAATTAAATTVTSTPSPAPAPTAVKTAAEFGLSPSQKEERGQSTEPSSVVYTVQSVVKRGSGEQVFTMQDGQVWVETEAYTRARVRQGDVVTIRKAALGSFTLVTAQRSGTKVRRVL